MPLKNCSFLFLWEKFLSLTEKYSCGIFQDWSEYFGRCKPIMFIVAHFREFALCTIAILCPWWLSLCVCICLFVQRLQLRNHPCGSCEIGEYILHEIFMPVANSSSVDQIAGELLLIKCGWKCARISWLLGSYIIRFTLNSRLVQKVRPLWETHTIWLGVFYYLLAI